MSGRTRALSVVIGTALLAGMLAGGAADAKGKKKGPVVMGTDAAGDWGSNVDPTIAPAGDLLGQELLEASIASKDRKTLDFIIKVASLPSSGGVPEFTRYVWTIAVDGELVQIDGKFTNYSRGACDPTAGTCPPPRDPGEAPFAIRGNCSDNSGTAVTCDELGFANGTFDAAAGTITVPVTLKLLGAKPGSKITHGTQTGSNFAGVWAIPSAFVSQGDMPLDELILTNTFTVPR
jgi:hypothetical protein